MGSQLKNCIIMANKNDIKKKLIGDVCRFILFSTQTGKAIKKSDISAIVRKANDWKPHEIIELAKTKLSQGFGFDLREGKGGYFLVCKDEYRNDVEDKMKLRGKLLNTNQSMKAYRGLIAVVLQVLILHGNKCQKDIFDRDVFNKLDTSMFGSQKHIIAALKQEKWIEEEKETQTGEERVYYRIGPRANIETKSEYMYIAAYELVEGHRPPSGDRSLQRIVNEKKSMQAVKRGRNNSSQRGRGRSSQRRRR